MTTYELVLPYTRPPLNLNDRMHWAPANTWKGQIKDDVQRLAIARRLPKAVPFVTVELIWFPPDRRRRDTDNPTPTLKAAIDGLVRYGLVPDDNFSHVKSWCTIGVVVKGGKVALNITIDDDRTVAA